MVKRGKRQVNDMNREPALSGAPASLQRHGTAQLGYPFRPVNIIGQKSRRRAWVAQCCAAHFQQQLDHSAACIAPASLSY
jgi:hypothetical protein